MSKNTGLSRRAFLGLGATAAVAGAAGLAGCAPAAKEDGNGTAQAATASGASSESGWRTPPAEITDFAQEIDCDVVVCGHGFAGITACRELAEEGKKVYLVEKQPEDTFNAVGNEFASLNSTILKERGVPQIDPVEFFQNWMTITGNYPNQELVMKFAQNSAETTDWYLSELTDDDFATMTTAFFPKTEHQLDNIGPIKFWPSATRQRSTATTAKSPSRTVPSSCSPPRRATSSWTTAPLRAWWQRTTRATSSSTARPSSSRAAGSAATRR